MNPIPWKTIMCQFHEHVSVYHDVQTISHEIRVSDNTTHTSKCIKQQENDELARLNDQEF